MYFQLNVTKKNISLYLQTLANLVEGLSKTKYELEQLSEADETLNRNYLVKNEIMTFLLFCLEKIEGRSLPIILGIKANLGRIILIIDQELEKERSCIMEQKMKSLSLTGVSSDISKREQRYNIFAMRLAKLKEIVEAIDVIVLKRQAQMSTSNQAYIQFSFEEYVYYSGKFKAKNAFLDNFFMAFVCLGEKHFSFPGPLADSKYYLKLALFNAQKNLEAELDLQDEVSVQDSQEMAVHEQPMMVVSPSMKRSSACLNILGLEEDYSTDNNTSITPDPEPPPRSPSALRFLP
jgi:hypothetical protein